MTTTLRYTSSRRQDNLVNIARVAAAGRVAAARKAQDGRKSLTTRLAAAYVAEAREAGATSIGFKVCYEQGGKWRHVGSLEVGQKYLESVLNESDVECWGLNDASEYVWAMQ